MSSTHPPVQRQDLPEGLHTLADHEALALSFLPEPVRAYFRGGAADEITLRANQTAWSQWPLRPRVLQALQRPDTRVRLLGRDCPTPLLAAPMANQQLAHPDGERALALTASAMGTGMVLSMQTNTPLSDVAAHYKPGPQTGPLWLQLYAHHDPHWTLDLIQQAHAAGYEALVLTVDAPLAGVRDQERRAGFALPPHLRNPHCPPAGPGTPAHWREQCRQAPTWHTVEWLQTHSPLPLLLKGISHPLDADMACRHGVAGLIVSNHGGRVLDTVPATAHLLPEVLQAVQGRCPVLVDGGIRRGTDVLKALALGASAVLLGRPLLYGLANAGATGAAHVLRLLLDEFMAAMALCGISRIDQLSPALLQSPSRTIAHTALAYD